MPGDTLTRISGLLMDEETAMEAMQTTSLQPSKREAPTDFVLKEVRAIEYIVQLINFINSKVKLELSAEGNQRQFMLF